MVFNRSRELDHIKYYVEKMPKKLLWKRYTPASCTLEIYHTPKIFELNKQILSTEYEFKIIFDDPKFPEQNSLTIAGINSYLEQLIIQCNSYIEQYLQGKLKINLTENNQYFSLNKINLWTHELTTPEQEKIILTNTQLFDLFEALSSFIEDKKAVNFTRKPVWLVASILGGIVAVTGAMWWQQQQIINQSINIVEDGEEDNELNSANLPEVLPPTSIMKDNLPPLTAPSTPLEAPSTPSEAPSPPLEVPTPSAPQLDINTDELLNSSLIIPSTPSPPPIPFTPSPSTSPSPSTTPSPVPSNFSIPATLPPLGTNKPNLANLPPLESFNVLPTEDDNPVAILPSENINPRDEIKNYFQERWQPPENLTQTITYQLTVNGEKGIIEKVTAKGAGASFFLSQTPIPLNQEVIFSPQPNTAPFTLELILSPNGDVVIF